MISLSHVLCSGHSVLSFRLAQLRLKPPVVRLVQGQAVLLLAAQVHDPTDVRNG